MAAEKRGRCSLEYHSVITLASLTCCIAALLHLRFVRRTAPDSLSEIGPLSALCVAYTGKRSLRNAVAGHMRLGKWGCSSADAAVVAPPLPSCTPLRGRLLYSSLQARECHSNTPERYISIADGRIRQPTACLCRPSARGAAGEHRTGRSRPSALNAGGCCGLLPACHLRHPLPIGALRGPGWPRLCSAEREPAGAASSGAAGWCRR